MTKMHRMGFPGKAAVKHGTKSILKRVMANIFLALKKGMRVQIKEAG
jgi:hypothetical protein